MENRELRDLEIERWLIPVQFIALCLLLVGALLVVPTIQGVTL